jgi:hypothetical protein
MEAVHRGMVAQLTWTYPGGGLVAEIDGRNRYRPNSQLILPAACARWPRGAAALRASAEHLSSLDRVGGHALAFLSETARYLHRHEQPDETPVELEPSWHGRGITACWRRLGPWQATLSGILRGAHSGRWLTDLANLVGVFHRDLGLLAGGGSSNGDPDWATFTVRSAGSEPLWQPTEARLEAGESADRLVLRYGDVHTAVSVHLTPEEADVRFELLDWEGDVTARLLRPLAPGAELAAPAGRSTLDAGRPVTVRLPDGGAICVGGARYVLPAGAAFVWPRMPFNPYNRDGKAGAGEAFSAFEIPLDATRPSAMVRISPA